MENRDRDKMSRKNTSTPADDVIGESSSQSGKDESNVDFGKNIGRSEDLEEEPSRRGGSDIGSSGQTSSSSERPSGSSWGSKGGRSSGEQEN